MQDDVWQRDLWTPLTWARYRPLHFTSAALTYAIPDIVVLHRHENQLHHDRHITSSLVTCIKQKRRRSHF